MKTGPFVLFIFGQKEVLSKPTVLKAYRAAGSTHKFELSAVNNCWVSQCLKITREILNYSVIVLSSFVSQ